MAQTLKYLVINMDWKSEQGISLNMYALCDMIYHLSNNKNNNYGGWCYMSKLTIAEQLDLTKQGVLKLIQKAIEMGFLEKDENTKFLRTTAKWDEAYITIGKQSLPKVPNEGVNKVGGEVNKVDTAVNKVYHGGKQSLPNNNIYNNNYNNNILEEEENNFSENKFSDSLQEKKEVDLSSEPKQTKKGQKSDSDFPAAPTKKLQKDAVEPGTTVVIDVYSEWFEFENGMVPKITIGSRKAAKEMAVYIRNIVTAKMPEASDEFVRGKTREFMERMFKKWGELEKFLQNQTKLEQINSNINNIVKQLSNGAGNNSGANSRRFTLSEEAINRIAENVARKHEAREASRRNH